MDTQVAVGFVRSVCPCVDQLNSKTGQKVVLSASLDELILLEYIADLHEWHINGYLGVDPDPLRHALVFEDNSYQVYPENSYEMVDGTDPFFMLGAFYHSVELEWEQINHNCRCHELVHPS